MGQYQYKGTALFIDTQQNLTKPVGRSGMVEPGTKVVWTSSSNGTTSTKTGIVEGSLPAGVVPSKQYPFLTTISSSQDKLGSGVNGASSTERVLVRVERTHATTQEPLKPAYYAPRLSVIQPVKD